MGITKIKELASDDEEIEKQAVPLKRQKISGDNH